MELEFSSDDRIIKGCDVSSDLLSCIGLDPKTNRLFLEIYDDPESRHRSYELLLNQALIVGEHPIAQVKDGILINLETENHETGYVYLFEKTDARLTELASYPIRHAVPHGSLEKTYKGANRVIDDMIVLASINYVLNENAVDLYRADGSGKRSLNAREGCTANHARIHDDYVILSQSCPDGVELVIGDIRDDSYGITVDFPFEQDDYSIRGIDTKHMIVSINEQSFDPEVHLYDVERRLFQKIEYDEDVSSSSVIPISLMDNRVMFLGTRASRTFSFLDLDDMRFETDENIEVHVVFKTIGRLMVFEGMKNDVRSLWSVDRVSGRLSEITETWNDFSRVYVSDTHVVVVDRVDMRVDVYVPDTP